VSTEREHSESEKIQITPEMMRAGVRELISFDHDLEPEESASAEFISQ
jgi:hypothetical protein